MTTTTTKRERMLERIKTHGRRLLEIFPRAKNRDPLNLCKNLRRLEAEAHAIAERACNGPEFAEGERDTLVADVLARVNRLLGNCHEYQPKTGAKCGCRRGVERDNCAACEGTGYAINFHTIRNRPKLVPIFLNLDARGYALKIDDEWLREQRGNSQTAHLAAIRQDWGGYGILAPDLTND